MGEHTSVVSPVSSNGPTVISIVSYRNAEDIGPCLKALEASTDPNFIVLVCENGGEDAFRELVAILRAQLGGGEDAPAARGRLVDVWRGRMPGGQIIEVLGANGNLGYAGGVNVTIERLDVFPDWTALWVLNPDTLPDRDALAALVERAQSNPDYGIVGSRLVLTVSGAIQAYGGRWRTWMARGFNIGLHQPADATPDSASVEREMTYVLGASMYVTRPFIETVGPMDEGYFLYVEEVDWCFRRGRYRLGYAHRSIIHHIHGNTLGSNSSRRSRSRLAVYLDERNKHIFSRKFFPNLYPIIALMTLVLNAQYLSAGAWRNFFVALSGWWAGLMGEKDKPYWMR